MSIIQEKYETIFPVVEGDPGPWATPESARRTERGFRALTLPPGENILDQEAPPSDDFPLVMSGESDVSHDYTPQAARTGFTKRPMSPVEDMETREHNDPFYDDVGGFVERNNMLDRS